MFDGFPRFVITALLSLGLLPAGQASAQAADWGLPVLLADISRNSGGTARFAERRFVAALDTPVDTTGVLVFVRPARLEKRTEKPRAETLIVDGDDMIVDRNGQRRNFSLRQSPEAAAMIEGLRATLAGDRATLERLFVVALEGSAVRWSMVLTPRLPEAARLLRQVRLSGERADLGLIEIDQSNGDRSVMRVLR